MPASLLRTAVLIAFIASVVLAGWQIAAGWRTLSQPFDASGSEFAGSTACKGCHDDRHASWAGTFHRTMTQEAGDHSVQGQFDGRDLDFLGIRVRPVEQDGRYFFDYLDQASNRPLRRIEIHRTVGSHRYQQYLTKLEDDGTYVRLHYLWHNGDQRWVHMNAAFLGNDEQGFDDQVSVWNQNCIFCHNTGPQPGIVNYDELRQRAARGEAVDSSRESRFQSSVAELGISCETCHGPSAEHVERAASVWMRVAMRFNGGRDSSTVNPVRLSAQRSTQICAQCHAQRIPPDTETLREWMRTGPGFRPGMDLHQHVQPVQKDTLAPIAGQEDMFSLRFWGEGTPRLSAYEYQGLSQSACYQEAELSCTDCHSMHAGDPKGQLLDRNRGNTPCLRCHQQFEPESELSAHTRHAPDGPGALCYNCHMPHLNYGVMTLHRSHRIEVPDARRDAAGGRPNACLNCHQARSFDWAADQLLAWPSSSTMEGELLRADGLAASMVDFATVLAGDPVQKSVAAWRAGREDGYAKGRERAWMVPYLLASMQDTYPSVRRFSSRSLAAILADWPQADEVEEARAVLAEFDFTGDSARRQQLILALRSAWSGIDKRQWPTPPPRSGVDGGFELNEHVREELVEIGRRADKQINIGE